MENYSDLEKAESAYQGLNKSDETSQIKNTAAAGETAANSHAGAHESGYAKQNGSSNATGSGNAAEKSGNAKNGEQAQEKKTEETAKENQEAKAEEAENADGEETSAENETALLSGEEGDAGVSMQNGEERQCTGSTKLQGSKDFMCGAWCTCDSGACRYWIHDNWLKETKENFIEVLINSMCKIKRGTYL